MDSGNQAFVTKNMGKTNNRGKDIIGHSKSKNMSKSKDKVMCYYYGKLGHKKHNCGIFKQEKNDGKNKKNG